MTEDEANSGLYVIAIGALIHTNEGIPYIYRGWTGPTTVGSRNHHFVTLLEGNNKWTNYTEYRAVKLSTLRLKFEEIDNYVMSLSRELGDD